VASHRVRQSSGWRSRPHQKTASPETRRSRSRGATSQRRTQVPFRRRPSHEVDGFVTTATQSEYRPAPASAAATYTTSSIPRLAVYPGPNQVGCRLTELPRVHYIRARPCPNPGIGPRPFLSAVLPAYNEMARFGRPESDAWLPRRAGRTRSSWWSTATTPRQTLSRTWPASGPQCGSRQ
jgi:hypothetical protein